MEIFNFAVYGAYINPAHAPLGTITLMNRKASIANKTAVCLMAGVVTESLLFDSAVLGLSLFMLFRCQVLIQSCFLLYVRELSRCFWYTQWKEAASYQGQTHSTVLEMGPDVLVGHV